MLLRIGLLVCYPLLLRRKKNEITHGYYEHVAALLGHRIDMAVKLQIEQYAKILLNGVNDTHLTGCDMVNLLYSKLASLEVQVFNKLAADIMTIFFLPSKIKDLDVKADDVKKASDMMLIVGTHEGARGILSYPPLIAPTKIAVGARTLVMDRVFQVVQADEKLYALYNELCYYRSARGQDKSRISAVNRCYRVGSMISEEMKNCIEAAWLAKTISAKWKGTIVVEDARQEQLESFLLNCQNVIVSYNTSTAKETHFARSFVFKEKVGNVRLQIQDEYVRICMKSICTMGASVGKDTAFSLLLTAAREKTSDIQKGLRENDTVNCKGIIAPMSLINIDGKYYNMFHSHRVETLFLTGVCEDMFEQLSFEEYVRNFRWTNILRNNAIYGYSFLDKSAIGEPAKHVKQLYFDIVVRLPGVRRGGSFESPYEGDNSVVNELIPTLEQDGWSRGEFGDENEGDEDQDDQPEEEEGITLSDLGSWDNALDQVETVAVTPEFTPIKEKSNGDGDDKNDK